MKFTPSLLRGAVALSAVVVAGVVFVSTLCWMVRYAHPLPWWDQWNFIASYSSLRENGGSWIDFIFQQHNEHRIAIPRLFFIADIELFHGRNTSLVISNIALQLSTWIGLCMLALPHMRHKADRVTAAAFSMVLLFSAAQSENFVWGFQVQFVGVYAAAVWACILASRNKVVGACVLAVVATLMMANGVFVWPVLALLVLAKGESERGYAWLYASGFVVCLGGYLIGYVSIGAHTSLSYSLTHPVEFFVYLTAYLGGVLGLGEPRLAISFGAMALLAFLVLSHCACRHRRLQSPAFWALWSIGLFLLMSGAVTASGRLGFGPEQALSGRYITPASAFLVCLFFIQASMVRARESAVEMPETGKLLRGAFAVLVLLVVGLASENHVRGRNELARRYQALEVASAAIASGSGDLKIYGRVHDTPSAIEKDVSWLKSRRLSIFSERPWSLVGTTLGVDISITSRGRCVGQIDDAKPVAGAPATAAVSGWAWDAVKKRRPAAILLVDPSNHVTGIATDGLARLDVAHVLGTPRATNTGWLGDNVGERPAAAFGLVDGGMAVCKLEPA